MLEKIKNEAPELQEVADQEGMNVMSLFNNIAGTLRTVSIEQTAMIYAVPKSVVEFVNENREFIKNGKDETISISVKELNIFCDENNFSNRTFLKIFEDRKLLIIDNDIDNDIHYKGYVYKIKGFPESILHLSFKGCGGNIALCN
jgi:hypothetical protein